MLAVCSAGMAVAGQQESMASLKRRADAGDAVAQFECARALIEGRGVSRDLREGLSWLRQAAARGQVDALYRMGIYREIGLVGFGVATNTYVVHAVDAEGTASDVTVSDLVMTEDVVLEADEAEALKWYRKAAEGGSGYAWWKLGVFAEYGRACRQDARYARTCYEKAKLTVPKAAEALQRLEQQATMPKPLAPDAVFDELFRQLQVSDSERQF